MTAPPPSSCSQGGGVSQEPHAKSRQKIRHTTPWQQADGRQWVAGRRQYNSRVGLPAAENPDEHDRQNDYEQRQPRDQQLAAGLTAAGGCAMFAPQSTTRGVPVGNRPGQGGDLVIGLQLQERGRGLPPVPPTFPPHQRIAPHPTFSDPRSHRLSRSRTVLSPGRRTHVPDRLRSLGQRVAGCRGHGRWLPCRLPDCRGKVAASQVGSAPVRRHGSLLPGPGGRRTTSRPRRRTVGAALCLRPTGNSVLQPLAARSSTLGRGSGRRFPGLGPSPRALGRDLHTCPTVRADSPPARLKRLHVQPVPVGAIEPDTHLA